MTPTEHAQLLRELASALRGYSVAHPTHNADDLADRARAAAEEIEGRRVPPESISLERVALVAHGGGLIGFADPHKALVEIRQLSQPWLGSQIDDLQRKESSRFGGGEVE